MDVALRFVDLSDPLYGAERALRYELLRAPLGYPAGSEVFAFEAQSVHLVALSAGEVVGCVLFYRDGPAAGRLFQMAVREDAQRLGVGRRLVGALEAELRVRGVEEVYLHARAHVTGFYERLGYAIEGAPFDEVGIPHRLMRKRLT